MQKYCLARLPFLFRFILVTLIHLCLLTAADAQQRYEFESRLMGTTFKIILFAEDDSVAQSAAGRAFDHIEYLNRVLSDYLPDSELSRLSKNAGSGNEIQISKPLYELLEKSIDISKATDGWFDLTIGPYSHIWRGLNRMTNPSLPDSAELADAESRVGYELISLQTDGQKTELIKKEMRLDPGGIGKGFAAQSALDFLNEKGISRALIDAGGDVTTGAPPPGEIGWTIAIPVQVTKDSSFYREIVIANRSVNTSGSLYQSVEIDGIHYSHIINPKTGLGHTEQVQVSVLSKNGADADAWATALNVMPSAKAKELIESRPDLEAVIFRLNEKGATERWASSGFDNFLKP